MNGFEDMVMQTHIEDFVKEMDAEFDQEIDGDKAKIVMDLFKDILANMDFDDTAHPAEHAVEEIVRAAAMMYMLLQVGSPATVSLMGRELIMAAVDFNEIVEPVILRLKEEMLGE